MKRSFKVGFLVAYDWYYLAHSLPLVYKHADVICLSIDKDRISWAGQPYKIDELGFQQLIEAIDTEGKIMVYEDDFHLATLNPMENEVRQRNLMADKMGKDGSWHVQLDADEYFLDFKGFVAYLNATRFSRPVNICCPYYIMFKQVDNGYLFIKHSDVSKIEFSPIATNEPAYEYGRRNGNFNVNTAFTIIHQSWARDREEILQKINNWGHKNDFDVMPYFRKWELLDDTNYGQWTNIHPIHPRNWEALEKVEAQSIDELIVTMERMNPFTISKSYLAMQNSIWFSRAKALWKKLAR